MKITSLLAACVFAAGLAGTASAQPVSVSPALATEITAAVQCEPGNLDKCVQQAAAPAQPATQTDAAKVSEAPLPVPEPETFVMLMLGLVALGVTTRRKSSERFDR